jgi:hypothetical protein
VAHHPSKFLPHIDFSLEKNYFYPALTCNAHLMLLVNLKNTGMKLLHCLILSITLTLALFSCRKEKEKEPLAETDATFTGTWELAQSYGGMMPLTNYLPGNGNLLSFTDTEFTDRRAGQVVQQGIYRLANDTTINVNSCARMAAKDDKPNTLILETSPAGYKQHFEIKGNTLKIWSGCTALDGGASIYKKVVILR